VANPAVGLSLAASAAPAGHRPGPGSMASLQLCPEPGSAKAARDFTATVLCTWGLASVLADARVVVSELVTNALRHGSAAGPPAPRTRRLPSRAIGLRLVRHPAGLRCEVTDPSDSMPTYLAPDDNAEIGRGLCLIAALSHQWGATPFPGGGKCVWADLRVPP
jgi:anti-sigma regulatory factor (Ser/Thr protein kinase)